MISLQRATLNATLGYNASGQLTTVDNATGDDHAYRYDGLGRRIQAIVNDNVTRNFLVAPAAQRLGVGALDVQVQHLATNAAGTLLAGWVYGGENPILRFSGTPGAEDVYYYLEDGSDSVAALADSNAIVAAEYRYDGFGNNLDSALYDDPTSNAGGDFGYHGAWRESVTGLYHMRARTYDPETGRYTSPDPASPNPQRPESYNPYTFANDNPHLFTDPTGAFSIVEINVATGIQSLTKNWNTIAVNAARQYLQDKAQEVAIEFLTNQLFKLAPSGGLLGAVFGAVNATRKELGSIFSGSFRKSVCAALGGPIWMAFAPSIDPVNGYPTGNGFGCQLAQQRGIRYDGTIIRGSKRPDIVLGEYQVLDQLSALGRPNANLNWTLIEAKLSTKTLVDDYVGPTARNPGQFDAIVKYTHSFTVSHSVAVFVTLFQGGKGGANMARNLEALLTKQAFQEGLIAILVSLTGQNNPFDD
jgi:RHS repeat-associated protein